MSKTIPHISFNDLKSDEFVNNSLYSDITTTYYWSDNFNPDFYIELAKKGLISTSNNYEDYGDILLPEMQEAYAVLYHDNLHISRKVKKLMLLDYKLEVGINLDEIIPLIIDYHEDECWLTESYVCLLYKLSEYNLTDNNFQLVTTILKYKDDITSGEIGYYIGCTYTSLTGFYNKEFSNWGTLQLVLLSNYLSDKNIKFWNMGHPYMDYKKRLGAKIFSRQDFVPLWLTQSSSCLYK